MDGLAKAYTGKPVIFLQYLIGSMVAAQRIDRFMAAWQLDRNPAEAWPSTPYTMVDSGQAISYGERDFQREYRQMVDREIPRPPQAIIAAARERPDTRTLVVRAQVTNVTTATLHTPVNGATVHVVVFTGTKALKTGTDILAFSQAYYDEPCPPGETRSFEFTFTDLGIANMSQASALVMVDYIPDGANGRWDMLQAALATSGRLPPSPTPLPSPTEEPTLEPTATLTPQPTPTATLELPPEPTAGPVRYLVYVPLTCRRWMAQP